MKASFLILTTKAKINWPILYRKEIAVDNDNRLRV